MVEATSYSSRWPLKGPSSEKPDPDSLACWGIERRAGAQHAGQNTAPHPGDRTTARSTGFPWVLSENRRTIQSCSHQNHNEHLHADEVIMCSYLVCWMSAGRCGWMRWGRGGPGRWRCAGRTAPTCWSSAAGSRWVCCAVRTSCAEDWHAPCWRARLSRLGWTPQHGWWPPMTPSIWPSGVSRCGHCWQACPATPPPRSAAARSGRPHPCTSADACLRRRGMGQQI